MSDLKAIEALKPVRCGCGGKAVAIGDADKNIYFVKCEKCWISTNLFRSKAEAIEAWNRAMSGSAEDELPSAESEQTAKFRRDGDFLRCSKCWRIVDSGYNYCPHCGAKLDWSDDENA